MDNGKRKFLHRALGTGKLDDPIAEKLAYLLATDTSRDEAQAMVGVDDAQWHSITRNGIFIRRLDYLKRHYEKKRQPAEAPKSLDEYQDFAMKQLWRLARTAKNDKDRVSACKVMAENAALLRKHPSAIPPTETKEDHTDAMKKILGDQ